jgi:hypothetical protein
VINDFDGNYTHGVFGDQPALRAASNPNRGSGF